MPSRYDSRRAYFKSVLSSSLSAEKKAYTFQYEPAKTVGKEYQRSKDLMSLGALLADRIIQFVGMVVNRSMADGPKELHDTRVITVLYRKADYQSSIPSDGHWKTYCHDSRLWEIFRKQILRPQNIALGERPMPLAVQSVDEDNIHIGFEIFLPLRRPKNVLYDTQ